MDEGLSALRSGRLEEAAAAFQRARFDAPAEPRIAYDLGIVAYHARRFDEAAAEFERVASSPSSPPELVADALHNLGNARFQAGAYFQAVDAYQSALARREDPETRYNLEQAQKRLAEQQAAQQAQQNSQDSQNQGQQQQGQQQQGQQKQGQQQQGQQQQTQKEQQGGQQAGKEEANEQQGTERGQGGSEQRKQQAGQPGANASDTRQQSSERPGDDMASGTPKAEDELKQQRANASDSLKPEDATASESTSWSEQEAKQRDVKLDSEKRPAKEIPDASQRARALKNQKLNAYMVERLLRQMEEREKEIQRRYRRDPSSRDRDDIFDDPFFMDPDRMREFMEGRRGKPDKPKSDTPDW
ncbi:MAG TPA: tetratricopeptide repeat protein [Candidatus Ozemobacteraceae bacterium]|nr:tetratricopeptide repeat protein [Candidatus Ozemobacteraceae bacterium]